MVVCDTTGNHRLLLDVPRSLCGLPAEILGEGKTPSMRYMAEGCVLSLYVK